MPIYEFVCENCGRIVDNSQVGIRYHSIAPFGLEFTLNYNYQRWGGDDGTNYAQLRGLTKNTANDTKTLQLEQQGGRGHQQAHQRRTRGSHSIALDRRRPSQPRALEHYAEPDQEVGLASATERWLTGYA